MLKVEAIKHTDVRGKELFYVKVSNEKTDYLMNVGQKSYEAIKAMEDGTKKQNNALDKQK